MKNKKIVSGTIAVLFFVVIFSSGCITKGVKEVIPISALEAWNLIEKDIKSNYPDARLIEVFAGHKQGLLIVRPTTWEKETGELTPLLGANDGKADKWQITLYSLSDNLYISVEISKFKDSETSMNINTREAVFSPSNSSFINLEEWKIDSTVAVDIINNNTDSKCRPWSITLDKSYISGYGWKLIWEINYDLRMAGGEIKTFNATIDAVSGVVY